MITNLQFLGIYEDAIDSAIEKAEALLEHYNLGTKNNIRDLHNWALEELKENGIRESITDSIITAYFWTAEAIVINNSKKAAKDEITYYVNCSDSGIIVNGDQI